MPPLAVNDCEPPAQYAAGVAGVTVTVGVGFTVTATVCVPVQPLVVPETV